ncbi:hypothetical protein BX666DRAFT_2026876 [Dichotomocladium elegans]|nr:hypothetical protein BX666DRAFT_2026876 [Dichotomocladium elegans]
MGAHGKTDVIRSLDSLIYCHIAYSYFLNASLVALLLRAFLQLASNRPLLSTSTPNQMLQTAIMMTTLGFLICLLIHSTSIPGQPGLLIDFVGNQNHASILRVIFVDVIIYGLQVVRILATSNDANAAMTLPQPLVSALHATNLGFVLPPAPGTTQPASTTAHEEQDLFYNRELVMDIELRSSLQHILSQRAAQPDLVDRLPV